MGRCQTRHTTQDRTSVIPQQASMRHYRTARPTKFSHVLLALTVELLIISGTQSYPEVFCFDSLGCGGDLISDSISPKDCCFLRPSASYQPAGGGQCINCHLVPQFSCNLDSTLCPNQPISCYCRVSNNVTAVAWNFNSQRSLCPNNTVSNAQNRLTTFSCGNYLSVNRENCLPGDTTCWNSKLTIVGDSSIDGVTITCIDKSSANAVVGSSRISVLRPPGAPLVTGADFNNTHIVLKWNTSSYGGPARNFTVNVQVSSSNVTSRIVVISDAQRSYTVVVAVNGSALYNITVIAGNCAGVNQTTHILSNISETIRATMAVNSVGASRLEFSWSNALKGNTTYNVIVTTNRNETTQQIQQCYAPQCTFVLQSYGMCTVSVSSYSKQGVLVVKGASSFAFAPMIEVNQLPADKTCPSASINVNCSLQNAQSKHCLVCCISNNSGEPISNVSLSSGSNTAVSLSGFGSNQLYSCYAAAVDKVMSNCTSSTEGSVKVLFTVSTVAVTTYPTLPAGSKSISLESGSLPKTLVVTLLALLVFAALLL